MLPGTYKFSKGNWKSIFSPNGEIVSILDAANYLKNKSKTNKQKTYILQTKFNHQILRSKSWKSLIYTDSYATYEPEKPWSVLYQELKKIQKGLLSFK